MMKVAFVLVLLAGFASAAFISEREYQSAFTNWTKAMGKSYTADEFQNRYSIFKSNMDYVRDWNAQNALTTLGLTRFADLTNAEYQKLYLGTRIRADRTKLFRSPIADTYNATVDWRTKGVVTAIKNQGDCGSCWSFSTTGSVEGAHALKTGQLVSLSEQNLVDCSTSFGNEGCNGGLMDQAFQYIIKTGGIDTEASYPYLGVDGTCHYDAKNSGATISSYQDVAKGDESALAKAALQQPVSVAIDASHESFQLYKSGIYHSILCSQTNLDHGVLVVGFGTDTDKNENYWIVKNSWGTDWGMSGYIYMSKDRDNNCGIATAASYPIV